MEATVERRNSGGLGCGGVLLLAMVVGFIVLFAAALTPPSTLRTAVGVQPKVEAPVYVNGHEQVVVDDYSHAAEEHPRDMPAVRSCLGDSQTWKQDFRTPDPTRFLRVCWDGKKTIIFQIIDRVGQVLKERTAYIRQDYHNPSEVVLNYIIRVGYARIKGGL